MNDKTMRDRTFVTLLALCLSVAPVFGSKEVGRAQRESNDLTLVTYDGSTKEKKKAKIIKRDYHADASKWHAVSVTFQGNKATVVVGRETVTVTSDRFLEPIEKRGIGHFSGTLRFA